jgi:hypothetical protein
MSRNVTECQQRLIDTGYLPPLNAKGESNADGKFGHDSLDAYNHFRATMGKGPLLRVSMDELNADLFPTEQRPAPTHVPKPSIPWLTLIGAAFNLAKGKTMTNDQFGGIVRTLLAALAAYVAGKGWLPNVSPEVITALTTILVGVWSYWTNRPSKIVGKS